MSNGKQVIELQNLQLSYIMSAKPGNHKDLFREVEASEKFGRVTTIEKRRWTGNKVRKKVTQKFRFINDVILAGNHPGLKTNFLEYHEVTEWICKGEPARDPACLAMTHISADGNLLRSWQAPVAIQGRTQEQIKATLGEEISKIVAYAALNGLPIVIEKLDFSKKKSEMNTCGMNRMLSHFAYAQFSKMMASRCHKVGIELIAVNPA